MRIQVLLRFFHVALLASIAGLAWPVMESWMKICTVVALVCIGLCMVGMSALDRLEAKVHHHDKRVSKYIRSAAGKEQREAHEEARDKLRRLGVTIGLALLIGAIVAAVLTAIIRA